MTTNRKFELQKDFKDVCELLDYDPSAELIERRNQLSTDADEYLSLADKEGKSKKKDKNPDLLQWYLDQVEKLRRHVEQIDLKMMPYLYARKSSHQLSDADGTGLFAAFATAVNENLNEPPVQDEAKHTTH